MKYFLLHRQWQGHRGTLKICGALQIPLCLPLSHSLCFIIKDDFSIQHRKHIEKFCTATPTGDRRVGRGRAMDEGRVTYQFSGQYFNKQNARDASGARRKHREGQRITLLIAKKKLNIVAKHLLRIFPFIVQQDVPLPCMSLGLGKHCHLKATRKSVEQELMISSKVTRYSTQHFYITSLTTWQVV